MEEPGSTSESLNRFLYCTGMPVRSFELIDLPFEGGVQSQVINHAGPQFGNNEPYRFNGGINEGAWRRRIWQRCRLHPADLLFLEPADVHFEPGKLPPSSSCISPAILARSSSRTAAVGTQVAKLFVALIQAVVILFQNFQRLFDLGYIGDGSDIPGDRTILPLERNGPAIHPAQLPGLVDDPVFQKRSFSFQRPFNPFVDLVFRSSDGSCSSIVVHRFLETKTGVFHPGFVHINRIAFLIGFQRSPPALFWPSAKAEFAVGNAFLRLF